DPEWPGGSDPPSGGEGDEVWQCPASEYGTGFADKYWDWPERTVGKLFFITPDGLAGECSGCVVNDSLVLTAGHCVASYGIWHTDFLFIPGFHRGLEPFGRLYVRLPATFTAWLESHELCRDVAFLAMYPKGFATLGQTVGHVGFSAEVEIGQTIWKQYGYPALDPYDGLRLVLSQSGYGHKDFPLGCSFTIGAGNPMTSGSSGGPWAFFDENEAYYANGLNSYGYETCQETMYSPYFDQEVWDMYQFMKDHQKGR
ncbi:MAG: trypsin-like peptidase domain-containing protein, partial [Deltaproteobacteria bacterium]|nr:trypsin-like peptidase domain-containing protein [Deltaproteobacteria bacterium]